MLSRLAALRIVLILVAFQIQAAE